MAFAITEPDAGSNSHKITTTARRDGDGWVLKGRKIYISGVDEADARAGGRAAPRTPGPASSSRACSSCRPTPRASSTPRSPMEIVSPEKQFTVFIDDVRLPADALVGDEDAGHRAAVRRPQPGADHGRRRSPPAWPASRSARRRPTSRSGRSSAPRSARTRRSRTRWRSRKIEIELARLMTQKAAALYDAGDDMAAGEAANMAKYAAAEAACDAADRAVQAHGGNGITQEYGVAGLLVAARAGRIAPVSREMILNFVGVALPWACPSPTDREWTPAMTGELVHYRVDDHVASLVLDSQHNRNALSRSWSASCTTGWRGPRPTTTSRSC